MSDDLRRLRAEAKDLDERAAAAGQVVVRGPGNPLFDAEMREWADRFTPRGHQTTPGRLTLTIRGAS